MKPLLVFETLRGRKHSVNQRGDGTHQKHDRKVDQRVHTRPFLGPLTCSASRSFPGSSTDRRAAGVMSSTYPVSPCLARRFLSHNGHFLRHFEVNLHAAALVLPGAKIHS